jgi:hypothetical protein
VCVLGSALLASEDRDEPLAQFMRSRAHSLVGCYELDDLSAKKGSLQLEIQPDGEVTSVTIEGGLPQPVSSCVMKRVRAWKFPAFRGPPRQLSWSLVFVPTETP